MPIYGVTVVQISISQYITFLYFSTLNIQVDCFGAGKGLCEMYRVKSWPQLKLFRKGNYIGDYTGAQSGGKPKGKKAVQLGSMDCGGSKSKINNCRTT